MQCHQVHPELLGRGREGATIPLTDEQVEDVGDAVVGVDRL
jgi:hypothetical protein